MLLEGIFLPLLTPFYPDGRVYLRKLEANVEHYSRTPVAGMLVLGEAGEADGLTDAEARQVLEAAMSMAANEKVMVAGISRGSVAATLELGAVAAGHGYDAVLVAVPACARALPAERMVYFRAVADTISLPLVVMGDRLSVEELAGLAAHPNVIGAVVPGGVAEVRAATAEVSRAVNVTTVFAAVTGRMVRANTAPEPGDVCLGGKSDQLDDGGRGAGAGSTEGGVEDAGKAGGIPGALWQDRRDAGGVAGGGGGGGAAAGGLCAAGLLRGLAGV